MAGQLARRQRTKSPIPNPLYQLPIPVPPLVSSAPGQGCRVEGRTDRLHLLDVLKSPTSGIVHHLAAMSSTLRTDYTFSAASDPNTELHEKLLKAAETIEKNEKDKKKDKRKNRIITQFNVILVGVLSATLTVKAALNTTSIPSILSATSPTPPVPLFGSIRWLPFFYVQLALTFLIFGGVTLLVQFATFTLLLTSDAIFDCKPPQAKLIIWATAFMLISYFSLFVSLSKPSVMLEWFVVVLFVVINVAWSCRSHLMVKVKAESEELPTHIRSQGCNCFRFKNLFWKKTPVVETLPEYQLLRLVLEDVAEQRPVDEAVRSTLVEVATHLGKQMEMRRMRSGAATPFEISSSRLNLISSLWLSICV